MRPDAAEAATRLPLKALVLGGRGIADLISEQLRAEGLQPTLQHGLATRLPRPGEGHSLEVLRSILESFSKSVGSPPGGRAHLVHPGVSPWAERAELLQLAQDAGLDVVAPPARVISLAGNRLTLLAEAERLGIPHLVLNFDPIHSAREVEKLGKEWPLVLKSVRGGGGIGLFVVRSEADLIERFPLWLEQLRLNVGEAILFSERFLEGARHMVQPFARLKDGPLELFPAVDSSLQHRFRKIVELCPPPALDAPVERRMREWTARLADAIGFVGVGSMEFLVDSSRAYLLGLSPRLGAGYRLWETVAGTSAVAWQLAALGVRGVPTREPKRESASGLSLRVLAEDPLLGLPRPGVVRELSEPREWKLPGASAELRLSVAPGLGLGAFDQPLLGVLCVTAADHPKALSAARGILEELWIAGSIETNEHFIAALLSHPWVRESMFHAGFIDEEFFPDLESDAGLNQCFASVAAEAAALDPRSETRWAVGALRAAGDRAALKWVEGPERWPSGLSGRLALGDGRTARVCAFPLMSDRWMVRVGGRSRLVRRLPAKSPSSAGKRTLFAQATGKIHSIRFREGAVAPAHQPLIILESMGVLLPHAFPVAARVVAWNVAPEADVLLGQELAELETGHSQ